MGLFVGSISYPKSFYCPVGKKLMKDPWSVSGCGHTFEKKRLMKWISSKSSSCPTCKKPITATALQANVALRNSIEEIASKASASVASTRKKDPQKKSLLSHSLSTDASSTSDETFGCTNPLHDAIDNEDIDGLEKLYAEDPNFINRYDDSGLIPFHIAIQLGRIKTMDWFHAKDSNLFRKLKENGESFVHIAASNGQIKSLDWLKERDPKSIGRRVFRRKSGFQVAAERGQTEVMEWFYQNDPYLLSEMKRSKNFFLLHTDGKVKKWLLEKDPSFFRENECIIL
ncbi:MAG: hypothetical protein K940chlam7_01155 [Chlamydiae bacterium]|nr:hypothetical protein [Chlamydiota bacterium]